MKSKHCVTVLFACSANGSNKQPFPVIGKHKVQFASRMSRDYLQNMKVIRTLGWAPKYLKITSHN
jgi:hypothetical protein